MDAAAQRWLQSCSLPGMTDGLDAHVPVETTVRPSRRRLQNVAFTLLIVAITVLLLRFMQPVLIPLVLGALLFYALDPAVDRMQQMRVPRVVGAALMLAIVLAGCGALGLLAAGPGPDRDRSTSYRRAQAGRVAATRPPGPSPEPSKKCSRPPTPSAHPEPARPAPGVMRVQIEEPLFEARTFFWSSSIGLMLAANQLTMIVFLTYFMLLSDQLFKRKLVEIVGTLSQKKLTVTVLEDIAGQIERFLVIQILTSAAVAVATWGALWAIGLQQAALWGLAAGILNSIPYYGPLLVTAGLSIVGFPAVRHRRHDRSRRRAWPC